MQPNPHEKPKAEKLVEEKLGDFSQKETEQLVNDFQSSFDECVSACKKPNILVTGITGSGKSTLVNAVFGEKVCEVGVGIPVTQHFQKFEPKNLPLVLYDSKGLEWDQHETFIHETTKFFSQLRAKKDVSEHIHCVWYVINAGRGRIDDFEISLIKNVISPTPVLFILNKADLADAEQLKKLIEVLKESNLSRNKIFITVSNRKTYTQCWCPKCLFDDVFYDEETKELECVSPNCGFMIPLEPTYGLEQLIEVTTKLLPDFAKDAFVFCQNVSQKQKDRRAFQIVTEIVKKVSIDLKGTFIKKVAEMCAKMFVIWGYPLTASAFREEISSIQTQYVKDLNFKQRFLISSIDTILRKKISKCFTAILGMTMNRGMKLLNQKLISHTREGTLDELKNSIGDFLNLEENNNNSENDSPEIMDGDLLMLFFEVAFFKGVDKGLEKFWSISKEELEIVKKESRMFGQMKEEMERQERFRESPFFGGGNNLNNNNNPNSPNNQQPSEEEVMRMFIQMSQNAGGEENNNEQLLMGEKSDGVKIEFLDDEEEVEGEEKKKKGSDFEDELGLD